MCRFSKPMMNVMRAMVYEWLSVVSESHKDDQWGWCQ